MNRFQVDLVFKDSDDIPSECLSAVELFGEHYQEWMHIRQQYHWGVIEFESELDEIEVNVNIQTFLHPEVELYSLWKCVWHQK